MFNFIYANRSIVKKEESPPLVHGVLNDGTDGELG
jgi:hypothetical protein